MISTTIDYSTSRTRTGAKRILEAAMRCNWLSDLMWQVVGTKAGREYTAVFPGLRVPVIPVGGDPEESRHWAELLAGLFAAANPRDMDFAPQLIGREVLDAKVPGQWYEWPTGYDGVCARCGQIIQWTTVEDACCGECGSPTWYIDSD